ncbi:2-keto-4-pentenoate hydratase [Piedraia hortae CBS 480.64]|uniref:2-keto-4-pentenoate hydratase n=1 Tax=Piedraia hortae CBS 480.64 TaxID=1314780 RepID=A0A6A7BWF7_9PEZI|nr:2-keto-4-pentenoate hydratase [Piedraia hortae CBS 480.64]
MPLASRRLAARLYSTTTSPLHRIQSSCRKVICIGRNYAAHISELKNPTPTQPFFFLKPPSSILLANKNDPKGSEPNRSSPKESPPSILRPKGVSLHHEIELGLVIGSPIRNLPTTIPLKETLSYVNNYVLALDMTARNVQDDAKRQGLPWSIAKGFDTFLPLAGPVDKSSLPRPEDVEIWCDVNGKQRQRGRTNLMLFGITRVLAEISSVMMLEPGDVVLTGTPEGVGEVKPGDVLECGMRDPESGEVLAEMKVGVEEREGGFVYSKS